MVFESMYYVFVCLVGTTSLLVSRAVIWDTVGIHNGYMFWGVVRRADIPMHQTLYGKIGGVEELQKNSYVRMFCVVSNRIRVC